MKINWSQRGGVIAINSLYIAHKRVVLWEKEFRQGSAKWFFCKFLAVKFLRMLIPLEKTAS